MSKGTNGLRQRRSVIHLTPVIDAELEMAAALQLIYEEGPLAEVQVHVARVLIDRGFVTPDDLIVGGHLMKDRGVDWLRKHCYVVKAPDGKLQNILVKGQAKT